MYLADNQFEKMKSDWNIIISRLSQTTNTSASLFVTSRITIMVLQLEQIPEGAVAINDGEENREASETGSGYLRDLVLFNTKTSSEVLI